MESPLITNDAIVLGLLVGVLGLVFYTRSLGGRWTTFYTFVPVLLLCYLLPSLDEQFWTDIQRRLQSLAGREELLPAGLSRI